MPWPPLAFVHTVVIPWTSMSTPEAFSKEIFLFGLTILKSFFCAIFKGMTDSMEPASMMLSFWYNGEESRGLGFLLLYSMRKIGVLFTLLFLLFILRLSVGWTVSFMWAGVLLLF